MDNLTNLRPGTLTRSQVHRIYENYVLILDADLGISFHEGGTTNGETGVFGTYYNYVHQYEIYTDIFAEDSAPTSSVNRSMPLTEIIMEDSDV